MGMGISLLSTSQIANLLDVQPSRIDYVVRKHEMEPMSRLGNTRLFNWRQVTAIRKYINQIRERESLCTT